MVKYIGNVALKKPEQAKGINGHKLGNSLLRMLP